MPDKRMRRVLAGAAVAGAAAALVGLEVTRRRDIRAARADPLWEALDSPIAGRPLEVESADGTRLHVEVFGDEAAPTVILVHGWTCAIDFWKLQIRELERSHRVVAYDQRGHGRSGRPRERAYTHEAIADDLEAVVEACLRPGQRCVVAGHSMGGMTIVGWAGRHPDSARRRVAAAALVDTGMGDLVAGFGPNRPLRGSELEKKLSTAVLNLPLALPPFPNPVTLRVMRLLALSRTAGPAVRAFNERLILACPAPVRAGFGASFPRLDLYESVPHLVAPTLVIVGQEDVLTPPPHARRMGEMLPDCLGVLEIPGVGHMSPLEAHETVTRAIDDLVRRFLVEAPAATVAAGT